MMVSFQNINIMELKDASFLIRIYSFLMSNNKVRSALTDMINIFYDVNVIRNSISHKLNTKNIYKRKKKLIKTERNKSRKKNNILY